MTFLDEDELRGTVTQLHPSEDRKLSVEEGLCLEVRTVLERYFSMNPHLSPVSFAYKIKLQERRIFELMDKKNTHPPTLTEIIAILTSIYEDKSVAELARKLPGRIGDYIRDEYWCFMGDGNYSFSADLIDLLKCKENYIIYKLAANSSGVTLKEVQRLFGISGIENAKYMMRRDLLRLEDKVLFAKVPDFSLPNDMFKDCLKYSADFISTEADRHHDNSFANISESLNDEAYQKVVEIQRKALRDIVQICNNPASHGKIPTFVIAAVDIME